MPCTCNATACLLLLECNKNTKDDSVGNMERKKHHFNVKKMSCVCVVRMKIQHFLYFDCGCIFISFAFSRLYNACKFHMLHLHIFL